MAATAASKREIGLIHRQRKWKIHRAIALALLWLVNPLSPLPHPTTFDRCAMDHATKGQDKYLTITRAPGLQLPHLISWRTNGTLRRGDIGKDAVKR